MRSPNSSSHSETLSMATMSLNSALGAESTLAPATETATLLEQALHHLQMLKRCGLHPLTPDG